MNNLVVRKKRKSVIEILFIISGVILPLISFSVFYLYVNLDGMAMSFLKPTGSGVEFAGFENFKWVFDRIFHMTEGANEFDNLGLAFANTTKTFVLRLVMFFVSVIVSYFIYKKIFGYKTFRVLFSLPMVLSSVVVSFFIIELMSSTSGFPQFLSKLCGFEIRNPLTDTRTANAMVFMEMIWLSFPGNIIIWGGTMSRIPDSIIESAKLDGVGWVKELFLIIIPLVWPTMVLMLTTIFATFFSSSGNVFLLTKGNYKTNTLSNWMYMTILQNPSPYSKACRGLYHVSAMGVIFTIIACTVAVFMRKFLVSRVEEIQY